MSWFYLVIAGLLEVGWAVGLKYTQGFTRPIPSVLTGAGIVLSLWLLALATRTIPIGTAYAVWTGIGVAGAATAGVLLFDEPFTWARALFLALLLGAIAGLKLTSS